MLIALLLFLTVVLIAVCLGLITFAEKLNSCVMTSISCVLTQRVGINRVVQNGIQL